MYLFVNIKCLDKLAFYYNNSILFCNITMFILIRDKTTAMKDTISPFPINTTIDLFLFKMTGEIQVFRHELINNRLSFLQIAVMFQRTLQFES